MSHAGHDQVLKTFMTMDSFAFTMAAETEGFLIVLA